MKEMIDPAISFDTIKKLDAIEKAQNESPIHSINREMAYCQLLIDKLEDELLPLIAKRETLRTRFNLLLKDYPCKRKGSQGVNGITL